MVSRSDPHWAPSMGIAYAGSIHIVPITPYAARAAAHHSLIVPWRRSDSIARFARGPQQRCRHLSTGSTRLYGLPVEVKCMVCGTVLWREHA